MANTIAKQCFTKMMIRGGAFQALLNRRLAIGVAISAPIICIAMNIGALVGAMSANVSVRLRAMVTAGTPAMAKREANVCRRIFHGAALMPDFW